MGVIVYKNPNREKTGKDTLDKDKNEKIAEQLISQNSIEKRQKILHQSVDKILVRHRNTRIFLFMLTGPFFLFFMVFKYSIKIILLTYLYRKNKKSKEDAEVKKMLMVAAM